MPPFDRDRRAVLTAGAGAATVALAGCLGLFEDDIEFDDDVPEEIADHLSNANNVDGSITDQTGQSELIIENGPGGEFSYDPALVRIDVGTTVTWEWLSDGHTVTSSDGEFDVDTSDESEGYEVTYTFEEPGNYPYECRPHASAGHLGAVIVEETDETDDEAATDTDELAE